MQRANIRSDEVDKSHILVSWSGEKDSALALHEYLKAYSCNAILFTTVTERHDRISMHGVRRILLERQADSLGIALEKVLISKNTSNKAYESKMRQVLTRYLATGVSSVVFGDIFLEDLRAYRQGNLATRLETALVRSSRACRNGSLVPRLLRPARVGSRVGL